MGSGASAKVEVEETKSNFLGRDLKDQQRVKVDGFSIPVSLVRCRDELFELGVKNSEIFKEPGSANEVKQFLDVLERGEPVKSELSVHAVAGGFKKLLQSLPHRLLFGVHDMELECISEDYWFIFAKLKEPARSVLVWVIAVLGNVSKEAKSNGMTPQKLSEAICDCLVHELTSKLDTAAAVKQWTAHLAVWIEHARDDKFNLPSEEELSIALAKYEAQKRKKSGDENEHANEEVNDKNSQSSKVFTSESKENESSSTNSSTSSDKDRPNDGKSEQEELKGTSTQHDTPTQEKERNQTEQTNSTVKIDRGKENDVQQSDKASGDNEIKSSTNIDKTSESKESCSVSDKGNISGPSSTLVTSTLKNEADSRSTVNEKDGIDTATIDPSTQHNATDGTSTTVSTITETKQAIDDTTLDAVRDKSQDSAPNENNTMLNSSTPEPDKRNNHKNAKENGGDAKSTAAKQDDSSTKKNAQKNNDTDKKKKKKVVHVFSCTLFVKTTTLESY